MIDVTVSERIEAPADRVWNLIGDFNLVRRWVPSVEHSTKMGDGIGAERTLLISGGARIIERLDAHDDAQRITTYSYVAGPLPVKAYTTTLRVNPDGDDACTVVWSSHIEPDGLPPEQLDRLYRELYRAGIANIRRVLG
jgi:hypothetical protein